MKTLIAILCALPLGLAVASGQSPSTRLTVTVTSVEGDNLEGQPVEVVQTDYEVGYGDLTLDAAGKVSLSVYPGNHRISIERPGFEPLLESFAVDGSEPQKELSFTLREKNRKPFALQARAVHDPFTGADRVEATWNVEPPVFSDDFESYSPFAIEFGDWTGIDADGEATAALVGSYPNRGVMQYAQIINPLTVTPTWWYDYPILRPYEGQQYLGFIRTSSGNPNDDWLISPVVTPGTDNELAFMAKAADRYDERFMVYVTTKTDNPVQADFIRIDTGNSEHVDHKGWHRCSYDLSAWEGRPIRFAIRYVADTNRYGAFMLMIDNVYVGMKQEAPAASAAKRAVRPSPGNPSESFRIFWNGQEAGQTEGYSFSLANVTPGNHTLGVQAVYKASQSEVAELTVAVPEGPYFSLEITPEAHSILDPEGMDLSLMQRETAEVLPLRVTDGKARVPSLKRGCYTLRVDNGAFEAVEEELDLTADTSLLLELEDRVVEPFNLVVANTDEGVKLSWNREQVFADSFEDYPDFISGEFGEEGRIWTTVDNDGLPVYPIALGNQQNIVSFPGSGTPYNPLPLPPLVFNPWSTRPPMLPSDPAIAAPTGAKTVVFFSPQRARADKWLISPPLDVRDDFWFSVSAKGYAIYPESMELCISEGSDNPADFISLASVPQPSASGWTRYGVELEGWAGTGRRLAVHYTAVDAFLLQVDDFTVGPEEGGLQVEDFGNIMYFEIWLDGVKTGETTSHSHIFGHLDSGTHRLGVKAVYLTRQSGISEVETSGSDVAVIEPGSEDGAVYYTLDGNRTSAPQGLAVKKPKGIEKGTVRLIRKVK